MRKLRAESVLLDGEGVICDENGLAIFDKLHSKQNDASVMLYAFDMLELDGEDCRPSRLDERKSRLRKLLGKRSDAILYTDHMANDGQLVFEHACQFGCEGIVAKRADSIYRSGRSKSWLKIKNPKSPAMLRELKKERSEVAIPLRWQRRAANEVRPLLRGSTALNGIKIVGRRGPQGAFKPSLRAQRLGGRASHAPRR